MILKRVKVKQRDITDCGAACLAAHDRYQAANPAIQAGFPGDLSAVTRRRGCAAERAVCRDGGAPSPDVRVAAWPQLERVGRHRPDRLLGTQGPFRRAADGRVWLQTVPPLPRPPAARGDAWRHRVLAGAAAGPSGGDGLPRADSGRGGCGLF